MALSAREIEQRLLRDGLVDVIVEEDGDTLVISGIVMTEDERNRALEMARELAPEKGIDDDLEVDGTMPARVGGLELSDADIRGFPGGAEGYEEDESLEPIDFEDQQTVKDGAWEAAGPTSALDEDLVAEGDEVYVPPIDPVGDNRQVIGGLQTDSMEDIQVERSALDGQFGDEAIADAVRRELLEDSETREVAEDIRVHVYQGVVHLHGRVPMLDDAENAEEVAWRVPGVEDVREELNVAAFEEQA